jgi:lipoprotein-anchoring transpeptidase ErfK/SrfK
MSGKLLPQSDDLFRREISRRDFLKLSAAAAGAVMLPAGLSSGLVRPDLAGLPRLADFPEAEFLARVTSDSNVRARPDINSEIVGVVREDDVVPWLREVSGEFPQAAVRRWVETPVGWVWSPFMQPVKNQPAQPVTELVPTAVGPGMWVQVCVPWVQVELEFAQPIAPWLQYRMQEEFKPPYLVYEQIFWVDQTRTESDGRVFYRLSELYGSPGDVFWGPAEAFRKIEADEVPPISPEIEDKLVVVNLHRQTVQAFEEGREVFFARCSTGLDGEETATPPGLWHRIWRKAVSIHMGGNTAQGYDTPGIGWTTLFTSDGVAFHATFWHNSYGAKRSHGCVNLRPEDAKWIWRWTTPHVSVYDNATPGDQTVQGFVGTQIQVVEY